MLVAQLKQVTIEDTHVWTSRWSAPRYLLVMLIQTLGIMPAFVLASADTLLFLFLWPFLLLAWLLWINPSGRFWALAGAWLCLIKAGTVITRMPACDFWPWLGCRSRASRQPLSPQEFTESALSGIFWLTKRTWASREAWRSRSVTAGEEDCRTCSPRELREAQIGWKVALNMQRVVILLLLLFQAALPLYVILRLGAGHVVLIMMAFVGGVLIPLLYTVSFRASRVSQQARRGLSSSRIAGTQAVRERIWRIERRLGGGAKNVNTTGLMHHQWLLNGAVGSPWSRDIFPPPHFVFLSYSRADDAKSGHVAVVAESLRRLGIPYYLDREAQSNVSTWRSIAAVSLQKASHIIVFAGPGGLSSNAVQRELRAALQRTPNELPPAIICVAECELRRRLLETTDLSPEWEFVLTWAAQLSPDELTEPENLGLLIRQRARQGLLKDWATHLGLGPSPLETTLALIQSSEAPQV
jgi:hypothetical protein